MHTSSLARMCSALHMHEGANGSIEQLCTFISLFLERAHTRTCTRSHIKIHAVPASPHTFIKEDRFMLLLQVVVMTHAYGDCTGVRYLTNGLKARGYLPMHFQLCSSGGMNPCIFAVQHCTEIQQSRVGSMHSCSRVRADLLASLPAFLPAWGDCLHRTHNITAFHILCTNAPLMLHVLIAACAAST